MRHLEAIEQSNLVLDKRKLPEGFAYQEDVISAGDEQALIERFQELPFKQFEFHGFLGNRRVVSFGWRYDFARATLRPSDDIPREAPLDQVRDLGPQCAFGPGQQSIGVLRAYSSGSVVNSNG